MHRLVDLRSDTLTQPTMVMRDAMARAVVGDVGYDEDPTVNELEERFASIVGKEKAVFVPSGVMANQIAVRILTKPGDLIVAGRRQHVVSYEMGASARNSSVQFATLDDERGVLEVRHVLDTIDAAFDHQPDVGLVAVENTHMPSGGTPWELEDLRTLKHALGDVPLYLDGARLFNAVVATGTPAAAYGDASDVLMACLSKGLCAPVGSLLAGSREHMEAAVVERKRLGGTMRQAGFLAAAGLVALDTMVERLAEDHARARALAEIFARAFPASGYDPSTCRTNIVAFDHPEARKVVTYLEERGVRGGTIAPRRLRFVTHAGVSDEDVAYVADVLAGSEFSFPHD